MPDDAPSEDPSRDAEEAAVSGQAAGNGDGSARRPDVLLAWALGLGASYGAWRLLPEGAGWIGASLAWVVVPLALCASGRGRLAMLGLWPARPLRAAAVFLVVAALVLPLFGLGYVFFCQRFLGSGAWAWPPAASLLPLVGFHLMRAGLPEEIFFRGYVQGALARRQSFGRGTGSLGNVQAIAGASALFALTHVAFLASPFSLYAAGRLLTFFPGLLFGLLREKTGSIYASALFHALCNAWLLWLQAGFLAG